MLLNSGFSLVCVLWVSARVNCRSIGGPVGVNVPDQVNYQDYGDQQEYAERQERDVEDRPEKYGQKEYTRELSQERSDEVKNAPEAAYRSRDNADEEEMEGAPGEQVAVDRRERVDERDERKEDASDAEVADHRNDEGLRQSNNDMPQADAGYRQPRENADVDPQEPVRMTQAARSQVAETGYDAMNEPQAEPVKDDSADVAGDYTNYDYAPEQGSAERADGQQNLEQNVAPGNEEAAAQSQYEQGN